MWEQKKFVNKIYERTRRNPLVVSTISFKVSKQTENSTYQDGNYNAHTLQERRAFCHPILVSQRSDATGIHREISAVYADECVCKTQVYNSVMKFKIGITSLHNADRGQAHKGLFH